MSLVAASVAGASPRFDLARSNAGGRALAATTAYAGICALIVVAPFEAQQPLLDLPGQSLSTVEAALFCVLGAWAFSLAVARVLPAWRTPLTAPWLALIVTMAVAALAAPVHRANAINMAGRAAFAFGVYLVVVNGVTTAARVRAVLIATSLAGAAVAILAVLEYFDVGVVMAALGAFRARVALVGAQVRAGGPLQYPTIASMFLEITFACVLALMLMAIDEGRRTRLAVAGWLAVLIGQAIVLTFTRAGLLTMASTLAVVGLLRYRRRGPDRGTIALAIVGMAIGGQFLTSRSFESLRLRLTTETMETWFRAEIRAPRQLALATGSRAVVPVSLRNIGGATWDSSLPQPFRLSYHWLLADEDTAVIWEGLRTEFPAPVPPGAAVTLDADVRAPSMPGDYRLMWDVEQEHRLWFSTEPDAPFVVTRTTVSGPAVGPPDATRPIALPRTAARPGRLVLWRAAADLFATRPLLGVGPDNYRLVYGERAGLANFDNRVHSNNMYIEMLVGGGLMAGLAFAWLCRAAGSQLLTAVRSIGDARMEAAASAVAAASVAIALHGLVDSFLSFTAIYILIAVTLGLTTALGAIHRSHAHRV